MGLALYDTLAIEIRHLLNQIVIVKDNRPVRSYCEGVFITGYWDATICCGGFRWFIAHVLLLYRS
jgi:hypothetical protein